MTEVKIASRTCPDEFGRPRTFHYALTVDTVESDTFSCENYGVRISEESAIPPRSQGSLPVPLGSTNC